MNIVLLSIIPMLFVWERKNRQKRLKKSYEYCFAFLMYTAIVFGIFYFMGILDSGYHLVDDHEVYTIGKDLKNYGFFTTLFKWLREDLNIRFRFTYYIIRVIECVLFGANFKVWHIFYTFLASISMFLAYVFARKMRCPIWLSYVFSILIFSGSQVAVFWRLGPQENLGTILLMLVMICLIDYQEKKSAFRTVILIGLTILLGGIKEAFLVLLPILPLLLVFWEIRGKGEKITYRNIVLQLRNNCIYTLSTWLIFTVDIFVVLFVVGTNEIGYAGIDSSFGAWDYIRQIAWSCLVAFRVYFFAIIAGSIIFIIPIFYEMFKRKKIERQQEYLFVSFLFFLYFMATQFVLHAKSGMYERYLLPTTIGFCMFWIVDLYHYIDTDKRRKNIWSIFVMITLSAALLYTGIWDRGVSYAKEGINTTDLAKKVSEYKELEPNIVVAMEYELDASIVVYLHEKYGIKNAYNVCYSGYDEGIVKDAYLPEERRERILFEEADIYLGYSEQLDPLLEERNVLISLYNRYDFGEFTLYVSKVLDN